MLLDIDHQVALPPNHQHGESSQGDIDKGGGEVRHEGGGGSDETNTFFRNQFPSGKIETIW